MAPIRRSLALDSWMLQQRLPKSSTPSTKELHDFYQRTPCLLPKSFIPSTTSSIPPTKGFNPIYQTAPCLLPKSFMLYIAFSKRAQCLRTKSLFLLPKNSNAFYQRTSCLLPKSSTPIKYLIPFTKDLHAFSKETLCILPKSSVPSTKELLKMSWIEFKPVAFRQLSE